MTRTDKYAQHEMLRNETKLLLQKQFKSISIYTRHVGTFYIRRILNNSAIDYTPIAIEKAGRCDDWFVLPCYFIHYPEIVLPIHGEIETKSGNSVLSPNQRKWRDKCLRKKILWFENRKSQQTIIDIDKQLQLLGLRPWTNF